MNTASLELCKELHNLSGWTSEDDRSIQWWCIERAHKIDGELYDETSWLIDYETHAGKNRNQYAIPAYNLGYLLRKLPSPFTMIHRDNGWECGIDNPAEHDVRVKPAQHWQSADTPEDAACKLAIELFKQGILTKERHNV